MRAQASTALGASSMASPISLLILGIALASSAGQKENFQAEMNARWDPNPFETSTQTYKVIFENPVNFAGEDVRIRVWATIAHPEVELQIIQVLNKSGIIKSAKSVRVFHRSTSVWMHEYSERLFLYIRHQDGSLLNPISGFEIGPKHEIIERGFFFSDKEKNELQKQSNEPPVGHCIQP
ncbi:hypothetical protein EPO15_04215 [bacterium]|nr:MAG: hypothetical protein EPO15_04215 [bacterium]